MNYSVWAGERLRNNIVIDIETNLASFSSRDHRTILFQAYDGKSLFLVEKHKIKHFFNRNCHATFIGHNVVFDISTLYQEGTLPHSMVFELFDEERIRCTKVMWHLYTICKFGYPFSRKDSSLKFLALKLLNRDLAKDESIRTTFDQFEGKPITEIPNEWIEYALNDVITTYDVYMKLLAMIREVDIKGTLLSHDIQIKGDFAINEMIKNGVGCDLDKVTEIRDTLQKQLAVNEEVLSMWGLIRGRAGYKTIFEGIVTRLGIVDKLPRTETGMIASGADDLEPFGDLPFISDYVAYQQTEKNINFLKPLTSSVIHPQYNYMVSTSRSSCSSPNWQNLPRLTDIRSVFIPKNPNNVLADVDYTAIELATLAQTNINLFGYSQMGDLINEGVDLHKHFASKIYNKDVEMITKDERQFAKIFNFGLGSNMSGDTFVEYAKPMGINITSEVASNLKDLWLDTFPEMKEFFRTPNYAKDNIVTLSTGFRRGDCTYTNFLNTQFQGLAAQGAKLALYNLIKNNYELVGFCHDATTTEVDRKTGEDKMKCISDIMVSSMRELVSDVEVKTEGQLLERYSK